MNLTSEQTFVAPALLWLHGFTQTGASAAAFTSILAGTRELRTPDLPGHGRHGDAGATFTETVDLLQPLLGDGCDLGGYSMGGRIALHLALAAPTLVRRLVLISTSFGIADERQRLARRERDNALAQRVRAQGASSFLVEWLAQPLFAGLSTPDSATRSTGAEGLAQSLELLGTGIQGFLGTSAAKLTMPTLIIAGERDEKFVAAAHEMTASLPDWTLAIIPNAGHALHLEFPAVVAELVDSFLAN
jgi:2-succinyl-6-hydroxy-2,4-cyclohexadiene-1-carboxylate synthase